MINARSVSRLAQLALLAISSLASLSAQTTVLDDVFADGNRTGQTPPASLNWLLNSGSGLTNSTAVGSFQFNNTASRLLVGYLTAAGTPVTVAIGQSLTLELSFSSDVTPAAVTNGFNLALLNSGGTRVTADFSGTSNAAFAAYDGYGVKTSGLGSTAGSNITLRQRNAGTSTALMSTSGDWNTLATATGTTTAAAAATNYIATLSIANNGASVALSYTLKTADGLTTLQTLSGTDTSTLVSTFDAVVLYAQTAAFPTGNFTINRVKIVLSAGSGPVGPTITTQPASQTVVAGTNVTFSVVATGTAPLSYQWFKNTVSISGATGATLPLPSVQAGDAGNYTVVVTNSVNSVTSDPATLTVTPAIAPTITTQPASQTINVGSPVTFSVVASGTPPLSYQWMKDNTDIGLATNSSLTLPNVQPGDAGNYAVRVTNVVKSITSDPATLTVNTAPVGPTITTQPASQTVNVGGTATFTVVATGTAPLTYQWMKNSASLSGATGASLTLSNVQASDAGNYSVTVSNVANSVLSNPAILTVISVTGTFAQFNLTGFATQGGGTTGGGVIPETDAAYVKVTDALGFANALVAASKTAGSVKVIEIMNNLDLGWNEIGTAVQNLASSPFRSHAPPKLHPVLLSTGMSLLDIRPKSGLTIFSANGANIKHCNFNIKGASNIIVRNLKFDENWEWDEASKGNFDSNDWDFITLSNGGAATNIWIDHCTFTKSYDGIMDLKAGTQYVTLSWCKYIGDDGATNPNSFVRQQIAALEANRPAYTFYNFLRTNGFSIEDIVQIIQGHDKTHLMGSNSLDPDNNTLSATFHHLWFDSMWDRCVPRLRGGNVHDYNIYVDDRNVLVAKRLRDARAAAMSPTLRNTLNNTYSFNPPINGSISTEGGAVLVEKSIYLDCLWPLRNNQTDPTDPQYTGRILATDSIYTFHNTDGTTTTVRGNSTDTGNPMGPFQATVIPFTWNLAGNQLPYAYATDDPAQLPDVLASGAGAGRLTWDKQNWLMTTYPNTPLAATATALLRHAPTINAGLDGSVQMLLGENVSLSGTAWISGDLMVPGTPGVVINGLSTYAGTVDGTGSISPTGYNITLNDTSLLRHVVRRTDPIALPAVSAPPAPTGTRIVSLTSAGQSAGDFATVRNLSLNLNAGLVVVPAGTYGSFSANGNSGFVLGVAGATVPSVYNFQSLSLNTLPGTARLQILGPIVVTLANGSLINGLAGEVAHPDWLTMKIALGGLTISGNVTYNGNVIAPNGPVTLNGNATLNGTVVADRLTINGTSLLHGPNP